MKSVIAKQLAEDLISYSISFDTDDSYKQISNMQLTGGRPSVTSGYKVVSFDNKFKGQQICIIYEGRPELAALVADYEQLVIARDAVRDAKINEEKAAQDVIDNDLLDGMRAKAAILMTQIPADHVEIKAEITGYLDGDPTLKFSYDGLILNWQDINVVGWASAVRPGAWGAFAEICVASIDRARLEEIKTEKAEAEIKRVETEKAEADRVAAIFATAKEAGKPQMLDSHMVACNNPGEECDYDYLITYALPDGTTKTERHHTW